jgi:kynurenine formamidase
LFFSSVKGHRFGAFDLIVCRRRFGPPQSFQKKLVAFGVLDDQFGAAVHGEHEWSFLLFEPANVVFDIALELRNGANISQVDHDKHMLAVPMFKTIIDLSVPLEHNAVSEPRPAQIHYVNHATEGLEQMQAAFGVNAQDLVYSSGQGWAVEDIHAITHTGTHVDAPYHYGAISEGKPARRIDEVPLEWCFAPGVVLDVTHLAMGVEITVTELAAALERISYRLKPLDIVLLRTDADKRLGTKEYFAQPGLGREGTLWLVEQGVKVIGIDAYTLDRPFASMVADYKRTGDGRFIWPAHFAGLTREYCQIEKLANLDRIPEPHGFYVSCLPVKIAGASAGWCRAVALIT